MKKTNATILYLAVIGLSIVVGGFVTKAITLFYYPPSGNDSLTFLYGLILGFICRPLISSFFGFVLLWLIWRLTPRETRKAQNPSCSTIGILVLAISTLSIIWFAIDIFGASIYETLSAW